MIPFNVLLKVKGFRKMVNRFKYFSSFCSEQKTTHQCDSCEKIFNLACQLAAQHRTPFGDKPFKCKSCQKSFSLRSNLTKQSRVRTGELETVSVQDVSEIVCKCI